MFQDLPLSRRLQSVRRRLQGWQERIEKDRWRRRAGVDLYDFAFPAPPHDLPTAARHRLSVCSIFKDEGPYLVEWIEFHRLVGVEHFYLYDNGSREDQLAPLRSYVREGIVTLIPWPRFKSYSNPQYLAYAHAVQLARGKTQWLAAIDLDEFLFAPGGGTVPEVLEEFDHLPAVGVFRRDFGTSGHVKKPEGLTLENFIMRPHFPARSKNKFKSIVKPECVRAIRSSHAFVLEGDLLTYNEQFEPIAKGRDGLYSDHVELLRVNHYPTRSTEEFQQKVDRGRFAHRPDWRAKVLAQFEAGANRSTVVDRTIWASLPELKKRIDEAGKSALAAGRSD